MKSGENYKFSRRFFLKSAAAVVLITPFLQACKEKALSVIFRITGTNYILGHRLRTKNFPKVSEQLKVKYLIVGGGISGLSAAREFSKRGETDFLLVELEKEVGGNSSNGENQYSKFPLGAHYLPLPNKSDTKLLQFLQEENIIQGYDSQGFPVFDEAQLTFAPSERLFYRNSWQEGLLPRIGNTPEDEAQMQRFFEQMEKFRLAKGADGKFLFDIPLAKSSIDSKTRALDLITMAAWCSQHEFTSPLLLEYINYCCRDDFGLGIEFVSAWVGIHYFAGRKHDSTPNGADTVLTWPEGNARLAQHLKKYVKGKSLQSHLVYEITPDENVVGVTVFDAVNNKSIQITAEKVIMACPQFVNQYLLPDRKKMAQDFHYAPWLLATLVVTDLGDNGSYPLCWDNVIQGAKGLGYIYDQQQSVQQVHRKTVITYYYSFSSDNCAKSRKELYYKNKEHWKKLVFDDLRLAHPDIESKTEEINVHLVGHGMISPVPGFIFGKAKAEAAKAIDNRIFFAHSDLAGISIFEEAFHQGIHAVNQVLDASTMDT